VEPRIINELIQAAGAMAVAVQLVRLRLSGRFPAFFGFVILLALMDALFSFLNYRSRLYLNSYVVLEAAKCIFSVFAVRELFALTFEKYPGIRTAGRWAMYAGISLAASVSLVATPWAGNPHGNIMLFYVEAAQRWVIFTLAVTILTILWSLSLFPLHLRRNTLISSTLFSVFFLCDAARLLIDGLMPYLRNQAVDGAESVFSGLCLLLWAALLSPEDKTVPSRITFTSPREDQLLQQLAAFNRVMTRSAAGKIKL